MIINLRHPVNLNLPSVDGSGAPMRVFLEAGYNDVPEMIANHPYLQAALVVRREVATPRVQPVIFTPQIVTTRPAFSPQQMPVPTTPASQEKSADQLAEEADAKARADAAVEARRLEQEMAAKAKESADQAAEEEAKLLDAAKAEQAAKIAARAAEKDAKAKG